MALKMDKKRDKHSDEKIILKTNDESELALKQAPTGNEVQDFLKGALRRLRRSRYLAFRGSQVQESSDLALIQVEKDEEEKPRSAKALLVSSHLSPPLVFNDHLQHFQEDNLPAVGKRSSTVH